MHRQREQREHADENRVPIQDSSFFPEAEIGPQRLEKITAGIQRDAAHHVAQRRSKEYGQ